MRSAVFLAGNAEAKKGDLDRPAPLANGAWARINDTLAKKRGSQPAEPRSPRRGGERAQPIWARQVLPTSEAGWQRQARAIIGEGAASAIDSVGGDISPFWSILLGLDGEPCPFFGTATGAPMPLNSGALIMKHIQRLKAASGVPCSCSAEMDPEERKR